MKKVMIIFLMLMVALFSACEHMQGTGVGQAPGSQLSRIVSRGELVIGTAASMPPLNMTTTDGEIIGMEADIAGYMAEAMGVKLRLEVLSFSELLPALEAGKVDMILSGMTITPTRNMKVAFVGPYFTSGKAFLTKMDTIASAKKPSDVDRPEITLAALKGSTSQYFVEKAMPKVKLITTKGYDEAVQMVIEGKVDAMIADYPICLVSVLQYPDQGLVSVITPLTYEPLGIAMPANDSHLINWAKNFLGILQGTGTLETLRQKWFQDQSWLKKLPTKKLPKKIGL
jgi:polar amino acid transport system substrate-binding protein